MSDSLRIEEQPPEAEFYHQVMPVGLMPAFVISSETIRKVMEQEAERERNRHNKPPKPPKRPNIPIGRIALSN